ncbi:MAG: SMC family ATPase [Chloroflexi bacterium]|nr:SMC family ATPase [Chloroflexota bacterium]
MIPLRLTVKNFMCYRDDVPTLHFDSIHVACLCGDNGHGKTALLDAITWALWGVARATPTGTGSINALRMADLMHMGQTDMSVEMDFTASDQLYRVVRRHTVGVRGRNSRTTLELQIATDDDGETFRSISRNTVRETGIRISEILNMDFKTFVNTAYLAQGQADLFTTSTPTERKKCLAEVLDLSYYQRLSDDANTRSRSLRDDMQQALTAINLHSEETARKPEYKQRLATVNAAIAETAPQAESQREQVEFLRAEVHRLQSLQTEFAALEQRVKSAQADARVLRQRAVADEGRAANYRETITNAPQIMQGYDALQSAQTEIARLDTALSQKNCLDSQRAALAQAIALQEERIAATRRTLRQRISAELEPRANRLPQIKKQQEALQQRHATLAKQLGAVERQRNDAAGIDAGIRTLSQDNERMMAQMQDTRRKFDMLEQGDATCPLCNQPLGADGQQHLRAEYQRTGVESKAAYSENVKRIDALKNKRKTAAAEVAALEAKHNSSSRALTAEDANLKRDEQDSLQAQEDLAAARVALADTERMLQDKSFAKNERYELAELETTIAALEYDAEAHQQARKHVGELRQFDAAHHALNEAQANLPVVDEALRTTRQMLAERQSDIESTNERMSALTQDLKSLPSLTTTLSAAVLQSERLENELRRAEIDRGVLESNISRCEDLEKQISALQLRHKRLARDKSIYDELTVAFGKNGIQALVIESAIPQLQDDANAILGRVTDNRMSLKLELDESTSERLEIRIGDELGTRDYLTFSGGEAFRINFALRIALSRLLARRSGAPLPVLFIDEGFGSQDKSGQERLTEAIQSIQDEFEKIIVITHIEQMKESFPVRIEVSKGERGSTFRIV